MALSHKQQDLIVASWSKLGGDVAAKQKHGAGLFKMLFDEHGSTKNYFGHFSGNDFDMMTAKGKAHSMAVLHGLEAFVDCIKEADTMKALAGKMSRTHMQRGVPASEFEKMVEVFPKYLNENGFDKDQAEAWRVFLQNLADELKAAEK